MKLSMKTSRFICLVALTSALLTAYILEPARAQSTGRLVAIVNDEAISEYDLDQRVRMNKTLNGVKGAPQKLKQLALSELIDNILKVQEAKRLNLGVTEAEIEENYKSMSSRAGVTQDAWAARLKSGGVTVDTIKREIGASVSWRRVVRSRFGRRIQVENADVDREYERVLKNPRKGQTFYILQQILLPVERNAAQGLVNTRAGEARRIMQAFKGCARIKKATSGIFNVRVLAAQTVPREAIPAQQRAALEQAGPGKVIGPGRSGDGIVVLAFCGRKKVDAPQITREEVETQLLYRKFDRIGAQFLADLKRDAVIEYKDLGLRS